MRKRRSESGAPCGKRFSRSEGASLVPRTEVAHESTLRRWGALGMIRLDQPSRPCTVATA